MKNLLAKFSSFMIKWKWLVAILILTGASAALVISSHNNEKSNKASLYNIRSEISFSDGEIDNLKDVSVTDINKKSERLSDVITHKRTLFIYAAKWCKYCQKLLPIVNNMYMLNKGNMDVVVVFSATTPYDEVKEYAKNFKFKWFYDYDMKISERLAIQSVPFPVILEKDKDNLYMKWYLVERSSIKNIAKAVTN